MRFDEDAGKGSEYQNSRIAHASKQDSIKIYSISIPLKAALRC